MRGLIRFRLPRSATRARLDGHRVLQACRVVAVPPSGAFEGEGLVDQCSAPDLETADPTTDNDEVVGSRSGQLVRDRRG